MKSLIIRTVLALVALGIVWVAAGHPISLVLDKLGTLHVASFSGSQLTYEDGSIRFGEFGTLGLPDLRSTFYLGPGPGDKVSLEVRRSPWSWPTPFEMNFMTGHSPSWKRHMYYTFVLEKPSGAKFQGTWRYEQYYYSSDGWTSGMMTREGCTGMIDSLITPGR